MDEAAEPTGAAGRFSMGTVNAAVQTLAILGAGAWGIYTFVYEAKIVPGLAPPTVSVASALEKAVERGDLVAIRSTVTRTNVDQAGVRMLGLTYNVVGVKMRFGERSSASAFNGRDLARSSEVSAVKHYGEPESGEVVLRQGVLFEGATALPSGESHLNPGEAVSCDLIFYVDRTRFDSVRFLVSLSYNKLSNPPVPLVFAVGGDERLSAVANAANECGDSRIWAGAHFRFASDEGLPAGAVVAAKALRCVPPSDREAAARSGSSSLSALAVTSRGAAASASAGSGARPGPASPGGLARAVRARQGTGAGARWVSARAATGRKRWSPFP